MIGAECLEPFEHKPTRAICKTFEIIKTDKTTGLLQPKTIIAASRVISVIATELLRGEM